MYSGIFLQGVIYMEIQLWRSILCPYQLAVRELTVKFEHMIEEHKKTDLYSPIEQVSGRVKSVTSILEKIAAQAYPHGTDGRGSGGHCGNPYHLSV